MTSKKTIAVRVDDDVFDFIEGLAKELHISSSSVMKEAFNQYYFGGEIND